MKGMIILGLCEKILCFAICGIVINTINNYPIEQIETEKTENIEIQEAEDLAIEVQEIIDIQEEIKFEKPITNGKITSYYGMRKGKKHNGIDLADNINTDIFASCDGNVIFCGYSGSYGNLIKIKHKDGYETYYAHCNKILVASGDEVKKGDLIAKMGKTGNATGSHIHFEIRLNGISLDPYKYIFLN